MTPGPDRLAPVPSIAEGARLRIGMIAPPYLPVPPPGYGGTERVVATLVQGLVARGHEVTLFAAAGSAVGARVVSPLATPPLLGDLSSVADELFHASAAYRLVRDLDVVHDHTGIGPALGAMQVAGPPVVHTLHGPWTAPSRRLLGLLDDRVHLVAISRAQRAANPRARYAGVVYNGIDLAAHPFNPVKEDFLMFLGRINREKRPEVAVEVARRAGLPLVMVVKRNEPAEHEYWQDHVAPRLGPDVEVLDQPPHEVKVDLLGRARAMLFPIDWPEPFGLVVTEAMACGTPVIACPLGAAPELIDDGVTGFLCSTPEQMAEAAAAAGGLRPADSRARVARFFSAGAMVDGYERIFRSVVSRPEPAWRAGLDQVPDAGTAGGSRDVPASA